jgi:hypothetical protein
MFVLCGGVAERLSQNVPTEILPLLSLPGMDIHTAKSGSFFEYCRELFLTVLVVCLPRKLHREGVTNVAAIASADPLRLARIIFDAEPFQMSVTDPQKRLDRLQRLKCFHFKSEMLSRCNRLFRDAQVLVSAAVRFVQSSESDAGSGTASKE